MRFRRSLQVLFYATNARSVRRQRYRPMLYDPFFLHLRFLKKSFRTVVQGTDFRSVLDLGCGGQHYRRLLGSREVRYVGVDSSVDGPDVRPLDLEEDFDLGTFDLVICSEVLEHVFHYQRLIDNILKHLAPQGVLFLSLPFAYEIHGWAYHDYFRFTDQALRRLFEGAADVQVRPSNTYLSSVVQKINNVLYYLPLPYLIKLPGFFLVNLVLLAIEGIAWIGLKVLAIGPESPFRRVLYSFPLGFSCIVRTPGPARRREEVR